MGRRTSPPSTPSACACCGGTSRGLGISRNFTIYDDDAQQATVKICIRELGLEDQFSSPRAALSRISAAKNRGLTAEALYAGATNPIAERLASLFELYNRKLRQAQALDFDDLLLKAVELFESAPDVRDAYNQRFRYLLVDEFQDTNRLQYDLIPPPDPAAPEPLRGGRRGPVHLSLAGRRHSEHPEF